MILVKCVFVREDDRFFAIGVQVVLDPAKSLFLVWFWF